MVRVPSPKRPWLILIQDFRGGRGGVVSIRRRIVGEGPRCSLRVVEKDEGVENFVVIGGESYNLAGKFPDRPAFVKFGR